MKPPLAVTLDVTGTLFHAPQMGALYAEVLNRHGASVGEEEAARAVEWAWREFDCTAQMNRDRFAAHPGGSRGWWSDFLARVCAHLELAPPSRFAVVELYDRFQRADAWSLFPDVLPALLALQQRDVRLGVVSNWDERLRPLLEELELTAFFDVIVISAEVGVEKPHPQIFEEALKKLQVPAGRVLHVGDRRRHDVEGALAVGMQAAWVRRKAADYPDLLALEQSFFG